MTEAERNPLRELEVMKAVAKAMEGLDPEAVGRILRWASEVFKAKVPVVAGDAEAVTTAAPASTMASMRFGSLADLYAAAAPKSEGDKALVVGYWYQFAEGEADFDSQKVNTELKHLGHGVANITSAFTTLMARKPQLVIQTRKSGTSRQARKRYKLTTVGQQTVERMLKGEGGISTD